MPDDDLDSAFAAYRDMPAPSELGDELRDQIITLTEFKTQLDQEPPPTSQ